MAEPVWNKFLTERDKLVFDAAGYGQRAGFGERPAVVVIDVNYNFTGDKPEPILESIKRWPNSCGEDGWESMRHIKKLLDAANKKGLPVIYTTASMRADGWDRGSWAWKNNRTGEWEPNRIVGLAGWHASDSAAGCRPDTRRCVGSLCAVRRCLV